MAKDFTPIFDRVLIERADSSLARKTNAAGIIIPDQIKEKYQSSEGKLVKCGESCDQIVMDLLGKNILFAKYSGDEITIDGKEYVLATDKDIFGEIK